MTNKHAPLRPAATAIAAVLAFTSTAALAQVAQPSVQAPAAPPPVTAPPVATPSAPPVATPAPAPVAPSLPGPVVAQPTVAQPTAEAPAQPAARPAQRQATPRTERAEPVRPAAREAAPAPAAPVAEPAAPVATDAAPVSGPVPLAGTPGAPTVDTAPQPGDVTTTTAETATEENVVRDGSGDWILLGGIGLLAIAGLGGAAFLLRSRRRSDEELYEPVAAYEPEPAPAPQPVMTTSTPVTAKPIAAPAAGTVTAHSASPAQSWATMTGFTPPAPRPVSATPKGDRQPGYYEAMVDDGPTEENPFLTRKKRLVRAHFLDEQLRRGAQSPRNRPQDGQGGVKAPTREPEFA